MSKHTIIYHRGCADGVTAAMLVERAINREHTSPNINFHECNYQEPFTIPNEHITDHHVYIVDFSFNRKTTEIIAKNALSMVCLDHHDRTQTELAGIPGCHFNADKCGAMMAWNFFFAKGPKAPLFVKYIQDYDLWKFELPDSKKINACIQSYPYNINVFAGLLDRFSENLDRFVEQGEAILRQQAKERSIIKAGKFLIRIDGHEAWAVNNPSDMNVVAHELIDQDHPFGVAFYMRSDGNFSVSMRAAGAINVTEIAKKFGGGGHPSGNAASFRTGDIYQFLINIPTEQRCAMIINPETQERCPNRVAIEKNCPRHHDAHRNTASDGNV